MNKIKSLLKKVFMVCCYHLCGVNTNKVVFVSFFGKTYSDNPKPISEKLYELKPNTDIVWVFSEPDKKEGIVPSYIRMVQNNTFKMLYELATASVWVDNFDKPLYTYKGPKQFYVQTWHGDRGFKKTRYDSTFISSTYRLLEKDICDLGVAGSDHAERIYKSAFQYEGEVLKVGTPRNDCLVGERAEDYKTIKKRLKISPDLNIVLYAPTLRRGAAESNCLQEIQEINLHELIETLEFETKQKWVCFVRAHISVAGLSGFQESDKLRDVSQYEDMADLLLITDIYITDYSSSAGDFALRNKPIILFQNDRAKYIEKDRTFYFDIDASPYLVATNQKELLDIIRSLNHLDIPKNCQDILAFYGAHETGNAAHTVASIILKHLPN
jgi:CDP-glycerol glycerophosphotransferase